MPRRILRSAFVGAAGATLVLATGSAALATDCVIGVHSTQAPASSNWDTITALQGAEMFVGWSPECDAQLAAGYAALRAAHLPSELKVRTDKEIGANSQSPRLSDGKGLDHFDAGSPYPDLVLGTFLDAATAAAC